ncbi:nucleotidyltransferase substrate binding protein [bacterium]|nr:nucleotidyltransferase substrate binding protein [bacterium]
MDINENIRWKFCYEGDFLPKFKDMQTAIEDIDDMIAKGMFDNAYQVKFFKAFKSLFDGAVKTLKSYLRYQGIFQTEVLEVIKEAFYVEIIEDGQAWVDMLFDTKDWAENNYKGLDIKARICIKERYLPVLNELNDFFQKNMGTNNE